METVVITGSEGFIGGYIVEEALKQNYRVIGIDNLSKYGSRTRDFSNNKNYEFHQVDIASDPNLTDYFAEANHIIAGAAMIGGISYFHTYAYDLLAKNERIIASTCDAAIKVMENGNLKKVTYLSSSMVFESAREWPSKEGDEKEIPPPISSYGFQKLAVEYFARAAWDQYKLPYTILRPFNCVGVGENKAKSDKVIKSGSIELAMSHVVPDLVQKIIRGQDPVHILGTGNQIRCYTYGEDLAKGILSSLSSEGAMNNDFNLSTLEQTTVIELAEKIWEKVNPGKEFRFLCETPFQHDVQKRIPDVSKAKDILGFEARTSLDEMLDVVIPWVRQAIQNGDI